jgi:hypothetical protein
MEVQRREGRKEKKENHYFLTFIGEREEGGKKM